MEEYQYLQELDNDELINIINEMIDFEEVTKAFNILEGRDTKKALELGVQIIEQDKGDDFLQATIWDFMFFENKEELVNAVDRRKNEIGRTLLDDIIIDLIDCKIGINNTFTQKIVNRYNDIEVENKNEMRCDYNKFKKIYNKR